MITSTQIVLGFVILGGGFGIIHGLKRRRDKSSLLTNKPFLRGCFMIASAAIMLALVLGNVLREWIAATAIGILLIIEEYVIMAIVRSGEGKASDRLIANQPLAEVKEEETSGQVRKRGLARFVIINTALYGFTGLVLISLAVILAPNEMPLYIPIVMVLAVAVGGATASIRQWNWHERNERSLDVTTGRKK